MKIWRKTLFKSFILLDMLLFLQAEAEELVCDDISDACDNNVPGTRIEDPFDCHKFYTCVTNGEGNVVISDAEISCPSGYYFNDENQECLVEEYKCRNKCDNLFCTKSCDNVPDGTQIAYPNDCSKFRVCEQDSEPLSGECSSETPYFNGTSCSTEEYLCCDICTPYCEVAFTEVEDPYDCYSYYLCQSNDYIPESEHFTCESGKFYSVTDGYCIDSNGTACNSVCNRYETTSLTTTSSVLYTTNIRSTNAPLTSSPSKSTGTLTSVASTLTSTILHTSRSNKFTTISTPFADSETSTMAPETTAESTPTNPFTESESEIALNSQLLKKESKESKHFNSPREKNAAERKLFNSDILKAFKKTMLKNNK